MPSGKKARVTREKTMNLKQNSNPPHVKNIGAWQSIEPCCHLWTHRSEGAKAKLTSKLVHLRVPQSGTQPTLLAAQLILMASQCKVGENLEYSEKNLHISSRVQIYAHVKHIISAWLFEYTPLVPKDPFKHTESFTSEGAQVVCNSDRSVWWAISWLHWLIVCVLISSLSVLWLNNGPRGVASRTGLWWYVSHVTNIFTIHSELLQSCDHIIVEISLI